MKISINYDGCIGAGECVMAAPEVFDLSDEAVVVLKDGNPPAALHEKVRAAARACPAAIIVIEDDE